MKIYLFILIQEQSIYSKHARYKNSLYSTAIKGHLNTANMMPQYKHIMILKYNKHTKNERNIIGVKIERRACKLRLELIFEEFTKINLRQFRFKW
jgi:hypothetical protein